MIWENGEEPASTIKVIFSKVVRAVNKDIGVVPRQRQKRLFDCSIVIITACEVDEEPTCPLACLRNRTIRSNNLSERM